MALVAVCVPEGGNRGGQGAEPDRDQDGEVAGADSAAKARPISIGATEMAIASPTLTVSWNLRPMTTHRVTVVARRSVSGRG